MRSKIFLTVVSAVFILMSCSQVNDNFVQNSSANNRKSRAVSFNEAPSHVDFPLLNGGIKKVDVVKGFYIVKTKKDFNKSVFLSMNARIDGMMETKDGFVFWYLYKNDAFFIKRILQVEGVLSAEYDFTVYKINPPSRNEKQIIPAPIGEDLLIGGKERPMGLENGNMDNDPRMAEANYSLQITKALDAYRAYKDDHFKKPVLVGIIDTGFNYCHEDFWFNNRNGIKESVSYFVKSAYLLGRAADKFDYTLSSPIDSNDPQLDYAKNWLDSAENIYSRKFYEIPCTKVQPGNGNGALSSPDNSFFWNWDDGSHGTHCSGVIAARGDNSKGVTGVSWKNTKIASYKCFGGRTGGKAWEIYGALADFADYIEAGKNGTLNDLYKASTFDDIQSKDGANTASADNPYIDEQQKFAPYKDQGTYPVNMSLGGPFPTAYAGYIISRCLKLGILPVVAMGNDGHRVAEFPASFNGVLAVGATNGRDRKTDFSCSGEWISVCAPGDGILSTGVEPVFNYPFVTPWHPRGSGAPDSRDISRAYETMSGTSMATPFVTGVLAYLISFENAYNKKPGWFRSVLEQTADPLEGQAQGIHHEDYGYGRVNVLKAGALAKTGVANTGSEGEFDYTDSPIKIKLRNKRKPKNAAASLGLAGHPVYIYNDKGDPAAFNITNNNGEAEFFFLPSRNTADYFARVNVNGKYLETKFNITGAPQEFVLEYDSPVVYISTFTPHSDFFKEYSIDGKYDNEPDTIITIYEEGKLDRPVERFDYYTLDTLAFNATPGKTYYAEITCFQDPATGKYRDGMYGFRIGFDAVYSNRYGNNDYIGNPKDLDMDKVQPKSGMKIYELANGKDCWEPNDDFEQADNMGDFTEFADSQNLQTYILGCLTHQSDGLDTDIYKFSVPEHDDYAE